MVTSLSQPEEAREVRLRFHGDDPRTEPAPGAHPAADVRADVEADVTRPEERTVEAHHLPVPARDPVVQGQGPDDPERAAYHDRTLRCPDRANCAYRPKRGRALCDRLPELLLGDEAAVDSVPLLP
jgi:hypothetical protein